MDDIQLPRNWVPISNYSRSSNTSQYWFAGTFNGNGHKISGLTNKGLSLDQLNSGRNDSTPSNRNEFTYGFFASTMNATLKNVVFDGVEIVDENEYLPDSVGALAGFAQGNTLVEGITVNGSVTGYDAVAGIIGRARNGKIDVNNCINNATVTSVRVSAGIVGSNGSHSGTTCTFYKCTNNGNITSQIVEDPEGWEGTGGRYSVAGITNVNGVNNFYTVLDTCSNTGTISNGVNHFPEKVSSTVHELASPAGDTPTAGHEIVFTNCTLKDGSTYSA